MKTRRLVTGVLFGSFSLLVAPVLHAQVTQQALQSIGQHLQAAQTFYSKLSPQQRKMLSGGAANFFKVVEDWPDIQRRASMLQKSLTPAQLQSLRSAQPAIPTTAGPVPVSNPATDFLFGPAGGFTQSETSTALCGRHVVVGFNDSGSVLESLFATAGPNLSFNGFSVSDNRGLSFTDQGFLDSTGAGGNPFNFLLGDPVLACARSRRDEDEGPPTFYYSSLLSTVSTVAGPLSAVSVSKSNDEEEVEEGEPFFGSPLIAVAKDALTHALDKDWMAVNPRNHKQLAVTYTDFDLSPANGCSGSQRIAIEIVESSDGGNTWSAPTVIAQLCSNGINFLQGSQVTFSTTGAVYVAFEFFPNGNGVLGGREILFTSAPGLGGAFGPLVPVAALTGIGDGFEIEGGFRAFIDLQGMAVDRSKTATGGNIYIVWHDTSLDSLFNFNGIGYGYSDVFIAKSTNGGSTWSAPVQVNTNLEPLANGLGTDSYMPGVAVDPTSGEVGVCWYDRRNDPFNYQTQRFCGDSFNAGATFTNTPVNPTPFPPIHATDDQLNPFYFGDYDTVSSDGLLSSPGFIGAFQIVSAEGGNVLVPNPDVFTRNFN